MGLVEKLRLESIVRTKTPEDVKTPENPGDIKTFNNPGNIKTQPRYETTESRVLDLYFELWRFSHGSWKVLKRTASEEIDETYLDDLMVDMHPVLQLIKTYEKETNKHRYNYILEAEGVFESVKKNIKEKKLAYSPKELLISLLPGFIAINDICESYFVWSFNIDQNEIQRLKNLLVEKTSRAIEDAEKKKTPGLGSIDMPKRYFTYFSLDHYDSLPKDKVLNGHQKFWGKIRDNASDYENAMGYVMKLGKYGKLYEAHYPYVLYTMLSNLKRNSSIII